MSGETESGETESGETDLALMLQTLSVTQRPGTFVVTTVEQPVALGNGVHATMIEDEAITVVAETEVADRNAWAYDVQFSWLTLDVHSSLEAVGLTAAFADALGKAQIPCNVLAGFYHDHLLVPADRADDAMTALLGLRKS